MVGRKRILMMLNINSINSKTVKYLRFASMKIKLVVLSLVHGKISWNVCRKFIWTLRCWREKKVKVTSCERLRYFNYLVPSCKGCKSIFLLVGSVAVSNWLLWKIRLWAHLPKKSCVRRSSYLKWSHGDGCISHTADWSGMQRCDWIFCWWALQQLGD